MKNKDLIDDLNKRRIPVVKIDETLDKYKDIPLFQDKVDKANDILKRVGLPKFNNTQQPTHNKT